MNESFMAIKNALTLVGQDSNVQEKKSQALPTAGARASIDLLMYSTAESLLETQVNLREVAQGLFNWGGENRVTKNLIRAMNTALNTPGKYAHAVELTAYIAALAPTMQPDRLARLFAAVDEVDTAYAPARYTLQLSRKLKSLLHHFPEERQEKLAYSLWVESHRGRWWDLTAGQNRNTPAEEMEAEADQENTSNFTDDELVDMYVKGNLPYSAAVAERFTTISENDLIRESLEQYNLNLLKEHVVDPDVALIASYVKWLKPEERPESPVGNLVETLTTLVDALGYTYPEKPKKFSDLFPDVRLYGGATFPFSTAVFRTDGQMLMPNVRLNVVKNATELAENRDYMGNCTWSYKGRMENSSYVLYRLIDGNTVYNASMIASRDRWVVGEINSRHNRGDVPRAVRDAFQAFVRLVPYETPPQDVIRMYKEAQQNQTGTNRKYRYQL